MPGQRSAEKWKSKRWFNVYAPKLLGEKVIGEIPAADEKAVVGRRIRVSLSWITQNPAHSFMNVGLKVENAEGNSAHTRIDFLESNFSYLRSLVRRRATAIYTYDKLVDKNSKPFVVKLLAVTASRIERPKETGIRKVISGYLKERASSSNVEDLVGEIMEGKLQAEATSRISKIARINKLEVKRIELSAASVA